MKKIFALVLVLLMVVSFVACSNDTPANETNEETVSNKTDDKKENVEDSEVINDETVSEDNENNENNENNEEMPENTETVPENSETATENNNNDSNNTAENNSNKTLGNKLLSEFKSVAGSGSALAVAEKLSAYSELGVLPMGAMEVEPGLLTGFDNAEIKGFKEGAMFAPMMGTIPFVGYVFTLEDGADVSSFIATLTSNANRRWNICTEAEETVTGSSGNKVFFVMCNKSLEQ